MKKLILVFLLLIPIASALQFSPSNLQFDLEEDKTACKTITFSVETHTTVQDKWASDPTDQWIVSNFQINSEEFSLTVSYPAEIHPEEKEIELCLSGSIPGEYHGALIFRQEKVGNSIIQFAVWIKAIITEDPDQNIPDDSEENTQTENSEESSSSSKKKSSGGSTGGSSSGILWESHSQEEETKEIQNLGFNFPKQDKIKINTQKQEKATTDKIPITLLAITPLALIIVLIFILTAKPKY